MTPGSETERNGCPDFWSGGRRGWGPGLLGLREKGAGGLDPWVRGRRGMEAWI